MTKQKEILFWPFMITVFLGSFVISLSSSTINIALPYLMNSLNVDLDIVKWTMTGFMLTMGITAPLAAFIGEKISYKKLYLISITGFGLVSIFALLFNNIYVLIAVRIIQGLFGGVTIPATMAIIYQVIPKKKQVTAISIWVIAPTLAPAVGPTLSGFLIQYFGWKAIFFINIPLGIIAMIMGIIFMPSYKINNDKSLDVAGIVLSVIATASLLFAFSEGSAWGWTTPVIISMLVIGVVFMAVLIIWELRTKSPILNLSVFQYSKFTFGVIISCIINIVLYGCSLLTPIFLQSIQGMGPLESALILLPASLAMAVLMPIVGIIYKRIGAIPLVIAGVLFIAVGVFQMSRLSIDTAHSYIRIWMVFIYFGLALSMMPASNVGMLVLPKELSGYGSSILNWMKQIAASMSLGILTSILTARASFHCSSLASTGLSQKAVKGMGYVMGINDVYFISFIIILVALPFTVFLKTRNADCLNDESKAAN